MKNLKKLIGLIFVVMLLQGCGIVGTAVRTTVGVATTTVDVATDIITAPL